MGAQESTSSDPIINLIRNHLAILQETQQPSYSEAFFLTGAQKQSQNKQSNSKQTNNKLLTLKDLRLNQINDGRLGIYILLPPVQMVSIIFPIVDRNGDCVTFALYNNTSRQPIQQQFQVGQKLEICNPFFKMGNDGRELIRVDNPNNLIFVDSNLDEYFQVMTNILIRIQQDDQKLPSQIIKIQKQYQQLTMSPQGKDWFSNINNKLKNVQQTQPTQEQQYQEQPHFLGHHMQIDKMMNTPMKDMIDQNQGIEISEMMSQKDIFVRFQFACSLVLSDKQRALNMFENLLKDCQNFSVIYFNYGELAFELGIYDKCLKAMRSFLQVHKKKKFVQSQIFNFAHYHIGFSLMKLGQNNEAEQFLKEACKLDPQNLTFQQALSEFYFRNQKYKQAEDLSLKLVTQFDTKKRDEDDKIELQRSIHTLFKLSQQEKNFEKLVLYADKLAQLDEENFIYIYNDITHYCLDQLQDQQRKELIQFLQKSDHFDIICEELQLLYLLNLNDQEQKTQQLESYMKSSQQQEEIQIQQTESQTKVEQFDKIQEEITVNNVDLKIMELIKPEREEINFDKEFINDEIKQKKRKITDYSKQKQVYRRILLNIRIFLHSLI